MPVARIINGSAEDAAALAALLRELGYTLDQDSQYADLEIELQRYPREDALKQASTMAAGIGADVFLAPGALATTAAVVTQAPPTEDATAGSALSGESPRPFDPLQFSESPSPESADVGGSPQISAPVDAHQTEAHIPYGSIFGGLDAPAHSQGGAEKIAVQEWSVPEVRPGAGSRLLALLDAMGESIRTGVNNVGNGMASLVSQWRARRTARRELRVQAAERRRAAQQEKARQRAAQQPIVIAAVETRPLAAKSPVEAVSPRPVPVVRRRIVAPSLRAGNAPLKVLAIAAGAAACAMFAWLLLSGPDSSLPPANNNVEQQLPFGPVRINPRAPTKSAAVPMPPAAPAAYATHAPAPAPPVTKAARPHHAARRRAAVAEQDVTVRHFDGRRSANVTVSRNAPKHISDMQ